MKRRTAFWRRWKPSSRCWAPRPVVVARELTKMHEEFLRGTAAEIRAALAARDAVKGEITLLVGQSGRPGAGRHGRWKKRWRS